MNLCGVCDKKVEGNSIVCVEGSKWVHKMSSGVQGLLKKEEGVFRRRQCVILETWKRDGCKLYVFRSKLNANEGCRNAVIIRIRTGLKKFKELRGRSS